MEKFERFYKDMSLSISIKYRNLESIDKTYSWRQNTQYDNTNFLDLSILKLPDIPLGGFAKFTYYPISAIQSDNPDILAEDFRTFLLNQISGIRQEKHYKILRVNFEFLENLALVFDKSQNKILLPVELPDEFVSDILRIYKLPLMAIKFNIGVHGEKTIFLKNKAAKIYKLDQYKFFKDENYKIVKFYPPIYIDDITKNIQVKTAKPDLFKNTSLSFDIYIFNAQLDTFQVVPFTLSKGHLIKCTYIFDKNNWEIQKEKIENYKMELVFYYKA